MLEVWAACRVPSPMGGAAHLLPLAGGAAEQPAALMEALAMIDQMTAPPKTVGAAP